MRVGAVWTFVSTMIFLFLLVRLSVMRWCWVNFQCRDVLQVGITVGLGPTALLVGAGRGCLDIFSLTRDFSLLSPSLWETARYRLKCCLKGTLSQKMTNQPPLPSSSCLKRGLISTEYCLKVPLNPSQPTLNPSLHSGPNPGSSVG